MSILDLTSMILWNQFQFHYIPGYNDAYCVDVFYGLVYSRWVKIGRTWVIGSEWSLRTPGVVEGYLQVVLCCNGRRDNRKVHKLVAEAVYGPCPPGMQACHNDDNPFHNWVWNLRYDTPKGNQGDRVFHGTDSCGERNGNAILGWERVRQLRADWATGKYTYKKLGEKYATPPGNVGLIVKNMAWVDPTYQIPPQASWEDRLLSGTVSGFGGEKNPRSILTWEKVGQLRDDFETGNYTQKQLAEKYGIAKGSISGIVNNQTWFDPDY